MSSKEQRTMPFSSTSQATSSPQFFGPLQQTDPGVQHTSHTATYISFSERISATDRILSLNKHTDYLLFRGTELGWSPQIQTTARRELQVQIMNVKLSVNKG